MEWRVKGIVSSYKTCDCTWCEGHDQEKYLVDEVVEAEDAEMARKIVAAQLKDRYRSERRDWDWVEEPEVELDTPLEEDVRMRKLGAPLLPGMEAWVSS